MSHKIGIAVVDVAGWDPWTSANIPVESPLPEAPVVPNSWRMSRCRSGQFAVWEVQAPKEGVMFLFDLGIATTAGNRRAYVISIPDESLDFYKTRVVRNAVFSATLGEMKNRRNGLPRRQSRDATWQTRADAVIAAWEAIPGRSQLRIYDTIAGLDMRLAADVTDPEDLE